MNKGNRSPRNSSQMDQNSLGILSMENLKVFGDLSSFSKSGNGSGMGLREASNVHERLRAERLRAMETLEKSRPRSSQAKPSIRGRQSVPTNNSTNISELVTDETIDLNSSGSFAAPTLAQKRANISFEPAEITGRSTLCRSDKSRKGVSVADIIKTSFVEKARQLEKKLHNASQANPGSTSNVSSLTESSCNCSHSLPRTADLSNISLNGGGGFSFGSASAAANQDMDESFAPAELMQSKLVLGEISWAQEFTAMPTATLSNQAMQKIAAPPPSSDIETSVSNSVLAGDPDFSLGHYFQTRSENLWNIVSNKRPDRLSRSGQAVLEDIPQTPGSVGAKTPQPDNKTYTKTEANFGSKLGQNLMKKMQNAKKKFQSAVLSESGTEPARPPSNSEILSLSAIDKALRDLDFNSDTSTVEVVDRLRKHGRGQGRGQLYADEDKENDSFNAERTLCESHKHAETMSFTDSILNSTDFKHLQQSVSRKPLSPLADKPQILISRADNDSISIDADVDEWPSTPVKSPTRRVRRVKASPSPRTASPASSDGVRPLPTTDEDGDEVDENKTPVNKKTHSLKVSLLPPNTNPNANTLSSTRLDGCDAVPSSTEGEFVVSPSLGKSPSLSASANARNLSPMCSPRSCLSSPLLDSTTSSERRQLMPGAALRKANSSPAGSEASSTSGFTNPRRGAGTSASGSARSISRCSNSSEFSHRDGKLLPLKVTHTSLCWGSTKLRTDMRKSLQVKNTADKRLVVRLGIQGPGFQLVGTDSSTITLQAMECRSIVINFCPTVCGAAIGAVSFYAPLGANSTQPGMEIPLYGYGGNASISIQGLLKGPVGASFLTIGDVCELSSGPLTASFKFLNKGPLTAFVGISVDSTVLMKLRLSEAFEVRPSKLILPPHTESTVQVIFRPNREDMKNILKKTSQVVTLANMRIFCGDEPNRQRMRHLVHRMSGRQREKLTSAMLDSIWSPFPDEQPVRNISQLNEPPEFILDLVTVVKIIDVALTLNRDFDESAETSLLFLPEAEETVLFRTICAANSPTPTQSNMLEPVDELHEADTTTMLPVERNWSVQPASIELGAGTIAKLSIKNCFRSGQLIEVHCNVSDFVQISPRECYIAPDGGEVEIKVRLLSSPRREGRGKEPLIIVSMENERINVPVSIKL
ncbi:probable GPI-anchored adhesin-like protein PGA55 [Drosophila pseudoobscura]|uniref:Probable GPI-anchored adhesin-like protein PGA55 n=1 Tax=Drosophila pseudoobscura pseudoobscura TaxID=46245 RepID=A0A6I8UAW6_DROPS|nr:probable GPI-anchored adhesin-like protein PGA55 [Drosophila pseudoobscura]